jgi:MFS family permease
MITTFFTSYIYEIIGRKLTIFFSFFLTAIIFFLLPYTAPDYQLLVAARCAIGVTMAAPIAHPLIPDYVKRRSRGAAIAVIGVGMVFGEVFSMGILFNMTKWMNYFDAFMVASLVVTAFALFFLYSVRDPDLEVIRNASESRHSVMMRHRAG